MSELQFPKPIERNRRLYFVRHDIENHKRALAGLPPEEPRSVIELIPANQVAKEFGFTRRTLARRIAKGGASSEQAGQAA